MDSAVRAICYARFVERTGEQPSDVDLEQEAVNYLADLERQASMAALQDPVVVDSSIVLDPVPVADVPSDPGPKANQTIVRKKGMFK